MNRTKLQQDQARRAKLIRQAAEFQRHDGDLDVPSSYELNVAVRDDSGQAGRAPYHHLFATHARSVVNADQAAALLHLFQANFPAPKYHVSLTAQYVFGRTLAGS